MKKVRVARVGGRRQAELLVLLVLLLLPLLLVVVEVLPLLLLLLLLESIAEAPAGFADVAFTPSALPPVPSGASFMEVSAFTMTTVEATPARLGILISR